MCTGVNAGRPDYTVTLLQQGQSGLLKPYIEAGAFEPAAPPGQQQQFTGM